MRSALSANHQAAYVAVSERSFSSSMRTIVSENMRRRRIATQVGTENAPDGKRAGSLCFKNSRPGWSLFFFAEQRDDHCGGWSDSSRISALRRTKKTDDPSSSVSHLS